MQKATTQDQGRTFRPEPGEGDSSPGRAVARQLLVDVLTAAAAVSDHELAGIARRAGWPMPTAVQAVAVRKRHRRACPVSDHPKILADWEGPSPYLLIADPERDTLDMLRRTLRGWTAVIGSTVPRAEAGSSLRWARTLLTAIPETGRQETRLIRVDDHLSTLLLLQDATLMRQLTDRWLRPLAGMPSAQADRIMQTLLAWLEAGTGAEAARRLDVHPQTFGHRLREVEELFGPAMRNPLSRCELQLALHGSRLLAETNGGGAAA
ncbi:PucR family transcriptional regulator [Streptomyces sp. NPDC058989]|uniref:PucR family transcriptional regulator n=1 Tax=Streptomyces sp. NPDC058989 TaxID=3346686 RepID=UPI0036BB974F